MTDKPKTAPHPAAANDPAHAKKAKAAPKPAPRAPIPSVTIPMEAPASKGKIALAVATTVGAIGGIAYGIAGVAGRMLRRGR